MTSGTDLPARLAFLSRAVTKESALLRSTDERLFAASFGVGDVARLDKDPSLAERDEASDGRFGRLHQMVHDYIEDPVVLADALNGGHRFVPRLAEAASRFAEEASRRGARGEGR